MPFSCSYSAMRNLWRAIVVHLHRSVEQVVRWGWKIWKKHASPTCIKHAKITGFKWFQHINQTVKVRWGFTNVGHLPVKHCWSLRISSEVLHPFWPWRKLIWRSPLFQVNSSDGFEAHFGHAGVKQQPFHWDRTTVTTALICWEGPFQALVHSVDFYPQRLKDHHLQLWMAQTISNII